MYCKLNNTGQLNTVKDSHTHAYIFGTINESYNRPTEMNSKSVTLT